MTKSWDILVVGEINPDLILTGDVFPQFGQAEKLVEGAVLTIGSSSAIFACAAARLGLRVALMGLCGDDSFGLFMRTEMAARGVDITPVRVVPGGQTGLSVILNNGIDRAILTHLGVIPDLQAGEIGEHLLGMTRHLHVASYFLQTGLRPGLPSLFQQAHALGLTTSLDTNWDPDERWAGIQELLPHTDVFLPNAAEARGITGCGDPVVAARRLAEKTATVAVKIGAQGAVGVRGGETARAPSIPVQVVDTVGAGDTFDAGFLFGFLNQWDLTRSLRLGAVCGALSTQVAGGTGGQPTLDEALRHV